MPCRPRPKRPHKRPRQWCLPPRSVGGPASCARAAAAITCCKRPPNYSGLRLAQDNRRRRRRVRTKSRPDGSGGSQALRAVRSGWVAPSSRPYTPLLVARCGGRVRSPRAKDLKIASRSKATTFRGAKLICIIVKAVLEETHFSTNSKEKKRGSLKRSALGQPRYSRRKFSATLGATAMAGHFRTLLALVAAMVRQSGWMACGLPGGVDCLGALTKFCVRR